jgi:hypothetical protein
MRTDRKNKILYEKDAIFNKIYIKGYAINMLTLYKKILT